MSENHAQTLPAETSGITTPLLTAIVLIIICGGIYPVVITLLGGVLFPYQATGSIISADGRSVGSELVGQPFVSEQYFHGRPSAAGYDSFSLAGSNLAPSNPALRQRVLEQAEVISQREDTPLAEIPVDLLAASGSGIDPHISYEAAAIQVKRVARARALPVDEVLRVLEESTEPPVLGILGQTRVHVLKLNLALDRRTGK